MCLTARYDRGSLGETKPRLRAVSRIVSSVSQHRDSKIVVVVPPKLIPVLIYAIQSRSQMVVSVGYQRPSASIMSMISGGTVPKPAKAGGQQRSITRKQIMEGDDVRLTVDGCTGYGGESPGRHPSHLTPYKHYHHLSQHSRYLIHPLMVMLLARLSRH